MQCQKCCITCSKDKKQCESRKERSRAAKRLIYKSKSSKKLGGDTYANSSKDIL